MHSHAPSHAPSAPFLTRLSVSLAPTRGVALPRRRTSLEQRQSGQVRHRPLPDNRAAPSSPPRATASGAEPRRQTLRPLHHKRRPRQRRRLRPHLEPVAGSGPEPSEDCPSTTAKTGRPTAPSKASAAGAPSPSPSARSTGISGLPPRAA